MLSKLMFSWHSDGRTLSSTSFAWRLEFVNIPVLPSVCYYRHTLKILSILLIYTFLHVALHLCTNAVTGVSEESLLITAPQAPAQH